MRDGRKELDKEFVAVHLVRSNEGLPEGTSGGTASPINIPAMALRSSKRQLLKSIERSTGSLIAQMRRDQCSLRLNKFSLAKKVRTWLCDKRGNHSRIDLSISKMPGDWRE